jgi:hypothetical protein
MKNYFLALRNLESEVLDELYDLLRRKGAISIDDDKWGFFNFTIIHELELFEIDQLGIITTGDCKGSTIRQVIDNNTLQLTDFISLVEELREECKKLSI